MPLQHLAPFPPPVSPTVAPSAGLSAAQLATLQVVSTELAATLDPRRLADLVVREMRDRFGYEMPSVYFLGPDGALHMAAQIGYQHPYEVIPADRGVIGKVLLSQTPRLVRDTSAEPDFVPTTEQVFAEACVPILGRGELFGVINVETSRPGTLDETDITLLTLLAQMMAVALQNARLFAAAERRARELATLHVLSTQVASLRDPTILAETVAQELRDRFGYPLVAVYFREPDGIIRLAAQSGYPADVLVSFDPRTGVIGRVLRTRAPALVLDPAGDSDFAHWVPGVCTQVCVPIIAGDTLLGVLSAESLTPDVVGPSDVDLLNRLATQIAVSIENARLYRAAQDEIRERERADKLRALGQLASGAAHDLNQSLGIIAGYSDLALRSLDAATVEVDRANLRETLKLVAQAAMDGGETIKRLLTFARGRTEGDPKPVDVADLLQQVAKLTSPRWRDAAQAEGRPITLLVHAESGVDVVGWAPSLREALTNLVFNAVDALPDGGTIILEGKRSRDPAVATIRVADTGVGMPEEVQERVFEPFFTTKGERGTGLGLAQVYGIVQRHGGTLRVHSAPGRGATFALDLPLSTPTSDRPTAEAAAPAATVAPVAVLAVDEPAAPRGLRVLAVDDEPALARMVVLMLQQDGHTVDVAHSGEEALERLEQAAQPYDVLISDIGMGHGMNGWDLADAVRERWPSLRVGLATGWGASLDPDEARSRGVLGVLAKPYRIQDLRALLATVHEGANALTG